MCTSFLHFKGSQASRITCVSHFANTPAMRCRRSSVIEENLYLYIFTCYLSVLYFSDAKRSSERGMSVLFAYVLFGYNNDAARGWCEVGGIKGSDKVCVWLKLAWETSKRVMLGCHYVAGAENDILRCVFMCWVEYCSKSSLFYSVIFCFTVNFFYLLKYSQFVFILYAILYVNQ